MSAIFVTATGTEIGKTFVTAGLIRHFRASGRAVSALKPVVTGFDPADAEASDPGVLLAAMDRPVTAGEIERIAPWRYALPAAPDQAARREHRPLDFDKLVAFCAETIASTDGMLLIEGVGGLMVPLTDKHTVLDWIMALQVPALLVTGSYLGTISHTLTCLDVLAHRKLATKAIVVNETPGSAISLQMTIDSIANFVAGIPLVGLRRDAPEAAQGDDFAAIARLL